MSKWTDEQMLNGKKLIAKFDRYSFLPKDNLNGDIYRKDKGWRHISNLKYHVDWNEIHPVLDKLNEIGCIVELTWSLGFRCHIFMSKGIRDGSINIAEGTRVDTPILATFKAVVQFLEEYNKIKNNDVKNS